MTRNNMVVQYYLFALWKYQNECEGIELCSTHRGGIDPITFFRQRNRHLTLAGSVFDSQITKTPGPF